MHTCGRSVMMMTTMLMNSHGLKQHSVDRQVATRSDTVRLYSLATWDQHSTTQHSSVANSTGKFRTVQAWPNEAGGLNAGREPGAACGLGWGTETEIGQDFIVFVCPLHWTAVSGSDRVSLTHTKPDCAPALHSTQSTLTRSLYSSLSSLAHTVLHNLSQGYSGIWGKGGVR